MSKLGLEEQKVISDILNTVKCLEDKIDEATPIPNSTIKRHILNLIKRGQEGASPTELATLALAAMAASSIITDEGMRSLVLRVILSLTKKV